MIYEFNNKLYKRGGGQKYLPYNKLCFEIFKKYLNENKNKDYTQLKEIFNSKHCSLNNIVQNNHELSQLTDNQKGRYFEPIIYNDMRLFFSTQWGNNGIQNGRDCDNVKHMINFAKEQSYDIKTIEEENNIPNNINYKESKIKNIILFGAPGVGKTHNYKKLISLIEKDELSEKDIFKQIETSKVIYNIEEFNNDLNSRIEFITFHQSFGYEDFIEGFRPNEEGNILLENGIFKNICFEAFMKSDKNFYLVIDEINRGNISKIFGELITLIEESKRANSSNSDYEVTLPYSKEKFKVPSNLYIIGTMNTTDKSIALIDVALRRRFTFIKMQPNPELIENEKAKKLLIDLNEFIKNSSLGEEYQIGHSYFMNIDESDLNFVKEYKIKPLLEEYYYGDEVKLKDALKIIGI